MPGLNKAQNHGRRFPSLRVTRSWCGPGRVLLKHPWSLSSRGLSGTGEDIAPSWLRLEGRGRDLRKGGAEPGEGRSLGKAGEEPREGWAGSAP